MGSQQSSPEEMSRGLDIAKKLIKDHSIVVRFSDNVMLSDRISWQVIQL
jgi:hypothetical protein